jgi:hypothetical protein
MAEINPPWRRLTTGNDQVPYVTYRDAFLSFWRKDAKPVPAGLGEGR